MIQKESALSAPTARIAVMAVLVGFLVFVLKLVAYFISGSSALKADALESVVNIASSSIALFAVIIAAKPSNSVHPYGRGKIEFFSSAFVGIVISIAALYIIAEGTWALINPPDLQRLGTALVVSAIAGLLNGGMGWVLVRKGKSLQSKALEADGYHLLSDFLTSVGVLLGIALVWISGIIWLDATLAILVGLILARTGWKLCKESFSGLLDKVDTPLIEGILEKVNGRVSRTVITLHKLRAIRSGSHIHIDVHLILPEFHDLAQAHSEAHIFSDEMNGKLGFDSEWNTHLEPCRKNYCSMCEVQDCPIRERPFRERNTITLSAATSPTEELQTLS